jgi:protein-S-isoprenylcysteine O-methyltransferase Ste14
MRNFLYVSGLVLLPILGAVAWPSILSALFFAGVVVLWFLPQIQARILAARFEGTYRRIRGE